LKTEVDWVRVWK